MRSANNQGTAELLMRATGNPKWASYDGYMVNAMGQKVACRLTPGVHVLPEDKVLQLCESFPDVFTMDPEEIKAFQNPTVPEPTEPTSSESSTSAAPDSSTEPSTMVDPPTTSESEA